MTSIVAIDCSFDEVFKVEIGKDRSHLSFRGSDREPLFEFHRRTTHSDKNWEERDEHLASPLLRQDRGK